VNAKRRFILDADVFIQAHRQYYPFDICPGYWDAILHYRRKGRVGSIDRIKADLDKGKDDLARWATANIPADGWRPMSQM